MSSWIEQEEKFADDEKPNMNSHYETGNLKNTGSSACQSSSTLVDRADPITHPRDKNERRTENTVTTSVMQAMSRQETDDNFHRPEDETSDSALLIGRQSGRSNGEGCFENENDFQMEDVLQSLVHQVEVESARHFENEDNRSQCSKDDENDCRNAAEGKAKNVLPQPEILLQPLSLSAEPSRSQPGIRGELGTNSPSSARSVKLTGTREQSSQTTEQGSRAELGADPPGSVRFIKPTGTGQRPSTTPVRGGECRDIFETGGERSRFPVAGASCEKVEEIERLPLGDSPEPQIVISPSFSDQPSVNFCKLVGAVLWRWLVCLKQRTCRQFAKAPLFYLFSILVLIVAINVWDRAQTDQDVSLSIFCSFGTFMAITLIFDRGQFSHVIGKGSSCVRECRRGCGNADPCIPWCCCCRRRRSPEPRVVRHSQYLHLEEDGAFKHEIADVSRLDPKDCPQMKMVEQRESEHADSPDYSPEVSQVSADVHVGKRDAEKLGSARKHLGKTAAFKTKLPEIRSDRPRSRSAKTFRADIHAAELEMIELSPLKLSPIRETTMEDGIQNGGEQPAQSDKAGYRTTEARTTSKNLEYVSTGEDLGNNELSGTTTCSPKSPGGVFKKFSDNSPTFPRFADIRQPSAFSEYRQTVDGRSTSPDDEVIPVDEIEVSDAEEFLCEHYGQSVACSCAALLTMAEENRKR